MKVGKVIKIKAVEVNRLLFLIGVLWLPVLLLSCSDENDEQRIDEEQKEGIRVDFGNEVGYTPEDLKNWPHALFVFENKECVEVQESSDNASLFVSSVGDRMVALAYESKENLSWGSMASGVPLSSYHLSVKDVNEDIPQVWMGQMTVVAEEGNTLSLKPVTSVMKVDFVHAPEAFESLSFVLPGMANRVRVYSGELESVGNLSADKEIRVTKQESGKETVVFPMSDSGRWNLACKLALKNGETVEKTLLIPAGIKTGQALEMSVDFANYEVDGTCRLIYRYTVYGMSKWTSHTVDIPLKEEAPVKEENRYYKVSVLQKDGTWKEVDVHYALCSDAPGHHGSIWNDWNNSKRLRDTMSFVNFTHDFDAPVKIRVQKKKSFGSVKIRPSMYGITPVNVGDNTIEFTLPQWEKRKVSVEFDGDRFYNLMILPNRPDPDRPDPDNLPAGMKYYGPGEHNPERITLKEGETLYIDEGAVVYGKVAVSGSHVTITGRGILSGAKLAHTGETYAHGALLIETNANRLSNRGYFTISGITVVDSPNWTLSVYNTDHVMIDNINILCWILNGDGIDMCSETDATIQDCFIRTYDDCITLKVNSLSVTATRDIRIKNNLIWADYARGIVIGPESGTNTRAGISDCTIEDCVIMEYPTNLLETSSSKLNCDGAGLSISQYPSGGATSGTIENITFQNIVIDNISQKGRPMVIWQKANQDHALIKNVTYRNIQILDEADRCQASGIYTNGNTISGLVFDKVTYNGTPIHQSGKWTVDKPENVDIIHQ